MWGGGWSLDSGELLWSEVCLFWKCSCSLSVDVGVLLLSDRLVCLSWRCSRLWGLDPGEPLKDRSVCLSSICSRSRSPDPGELLSSDRILEIECWGLVGY